MARFYNIPTIKHLKTNELIYKTNIIDIPIDDTDQYIEITSPQRIDLLADDFYGNVEYWYIIAAANTIKRGSLWIPSGMIIRIPDLERAKIYIKKLNTTR